MKKVLAIVDLDGGEWAMWSTYRDGMLSLDGYFSGVDPSQPLPEAAVRAGLMAYCRISDDEYDWFMNRVGQGDDRFVQDLKTVKGILAAGLAALMEGEAGI